MIRRIWSLVVKEFIHLRRDWWMPAFMVIGGAMELLLIGWATSRPITNLPLMVLDQDQSNASRENVTALENTTTFEITAWASDLEEIESALTRGAVNAALVIPPGFSREIASIMGEPQLIVMLNGAESIAATSALRSVEGVVRSWNEKIVLSRLNLPPDLLSGFNPSIRVWFNEALSEALYTTPAELALMLEFTVLVFAALSFARERELGTLEQLLVMPFSSLEIIVGKSIPAILVAFIDFVVMLGIVHFAFKVPVRGSLLLLLIIAFGYLIVELGKGLVISVTSRTQHQAFLSVMLIGMVDFMFTGYAAPVESMPRILQVFANFIPAHHWLAIMRGILLKGVGLEVLWPHLLALIGLGIVIGGFSLRFVRRALA
ncbi:MAG: ABC transporter permease [Anaerolineaceae bacterium]|nr:MAG: ABC transporter permease [Anaerolineaceae bacterium]